MRREFKIINISDKLPVNNWLGFIIAENENNEEIKKIAHYINSKWTIFDNNDNLKIKYWLDDTLIEQKIFEDYIEYFKDFIIKENILLLDIHLERLNKLKEEGYGKYTIESLDILHNVLYHKHNLRFLDYFNYKRCIDFNLPLICK